MFSTGFSLSALLPATVRFRRVISSSGWKGERERLDPLAGILIS